MAAQHALLLLAAPPDAFQAVHVRAGLVERERRRAVNEPLQELVGPAVGVEGVDEVQQRAVRADDGRRPLARAPVLAAAPVWNSTSEWCSLR